MYVPLIVSDYIILFSGSTQVQLTCICIQLCLSVLCQLLSALVLIYHMVYLICLASNLKVHYSISTSCDELQLYTCEIFH